MNLEFDPKEHLYSIVDGGRVFRVPSVTQVLDPLISWDGVDPAVLKAAAEFGTHVHSAVALMLNKQLDWKSLDYRLVPYITAAQKFVKDHIGTVLKVEHRMCDPVLKVAGTMDLLGVMGRYTAVIDWKSSATMPRTIGLQTSAYEHLFRTTYGGRPLKRFGVLLKEDGSYSVHPCDDPRDWNWFVSALNIWWWRNHRAA